MSTAAEQLAQVEQQLEKHWWTLTHHQNAIRELLPMRDMLRAAVKREEAKIDKAAKKWCGQSAVRST